MTIQLHNIKPTYMSATEIAGSEVYLQENILFSKGNKYLIKASSGHGKSSILNFIYGNNFNYDGEILYNNSFNKNDVFDLRKSNLSYVFQDFKLFDELSIFDNIILKNKLTNHKTATEIETLLTRVQLSHKKDALVKNLSLGQRQRVAIIRALCQAFDFILLDEPFSHLDKENIKILTKIINEEVGKQQAGLIITTLNNDYYFEYNKILNL